MPTEPESARSTSRPAFLLWAIALWAFGLVTLCLSRNHFFFQDDAFITLRYARHVAEGVGPMWNRTGHPVEGFSSPLHVLIIAGLIFLHVDPPTADRILAFAFHAGLIVFVWRFMKKRSGTLAATLGSALIATSWPMLIWDLGGLEAVPFATSLASGTLLSLRYLETGQRGGLLIGGSLLGLAILTRPEALLVAIIAFGACLLLGPKPIPRRTADVALGTVLCSLPPVSWEIFRIHYFHATLPNTYYAKIVGIPLPWRLHSGLHYWHAYIRQPPYTVLLLLIVAAFCVYHRQVSKFDLSLWACLASLSLYLLTTGGDFMAGYRFMVPLVPLIAVALLRGLHSLGAFDRPIVAATMSVGLLAASTLQAIRSPEYLRYQDPAITIGAAIGHYIGTHWPSDSLVALDAAGATPYYADELNYIDMLGLNDDIISHRAPVPMDGPWSHLLGHLKADGQSVLNRRPDFVFLYTEQPTFLADYELEQSASFATQYKRCAVLIDFSSSSYQQLRGTLDRTLLSQTVDSGSGKLIMAYYQRRDLPYTCDASAP